MKLEKASRAARWSAALLLLACPVAARAAEASTQSVPIIRLENPELFQRVAGVLQAQAAWLEPGRKADCTDRDPLEDTIGCQSFDAGKTPLPVTSLKRLADLLSRCTWIRDPAPGANRPVLGWGLKIREFPVWLDVGVELDSMTVYLFAPGQAPLRGTVPPSLKPKLASVMAQASAKTSGGVSLRGAIVRRWGTSFDATDPCDSDSEGEFVYYENPPTILTRVEPVWPDGASKLENRRLILHVRVHRSGRVCSVKVLRGDPAFARAAAEAVEQWVWNPATSNGKPVSVWVEVPFDF